MTTMILYYVRFRERYRYTGDSTQRRTHYDKCRFFSSHLEAEAYAASQVPSIDANPLANSFFFADYYPQDAPLTSGRWLQQFTAFLREQELPSLTDYLRIAHRNIGGPHTPRIDPVATALDEWWWRETCNLSDVQYRAVWRFVDPTPCLITAVEVHPEVMTTDALARVNALLQPWGGLQAEYPLPPPAPRLSRRVRFAWNDSEDEYDYDDPFLTFPPPPPNTASGEPEYLDPFFP